jgi:next-to-BRCA1 protein 1
MLNLENTRAVSQSELDQAYGSNVIDYAVEAGAEIRFRVIMKAGPREGTAVSYWRLKTPSGAPFGDRLWCDIQVVSPAPALHNYPRPVMACRYPVPFNPPAHASDPLENTEGRLRPRAQFEQKMCELRERQEEQDRTLREMQERDRTSLEERMHKMRELQVAAVQKEINRRIVESSARSSYLSPEPSAHSSPSPDSPSSPASPKREETAEIPVAEKPQPVEAPVNSSGMIFPKLDKESPASSTHQSMPDLIDPTAVRDESSTVAESEQDDGEFFEDAESIEIRSFSSGDDDESFMTDEEYDILDASDEEAT